MGPDFFSYHPLRLRLWLVGGLVAAVGMTAWGALGVGVLVGPREVLAVALPSGVGAALGVAVYWLRPRAGWGVEVTALCVRVARVRGGGVRELPWETIRDVRRLGEGRDILALWLGERERVLVSAHLFASRAQFEALAARVDERRPGAVGPRVH